eukprot:scaffold1736_cov127-Cylindrotheca_fusiformis.AAC.105
MVRARMSGVNPTSGLTRLAFLNILLSRHLVGAFSPPVCELLNLHNSLAASPTGSSILQTPIDDDPVGLNHTTVANDQDKLMPKPKFSKGKWKKKRYLMMQDVQKKIQQNDPTAPRKAEEMVRRMLKLYEHSGNDMEFRPTQQAYNLWIHALAKSNLEDAGKLADQVMERMRSEHIEPNAFTYTCVMDAYARSRSPKKAEDVLFRLLEEGPADNVSEVTCDTMLNAWAQQGTAESAERAQLILYRLEEWQREDIRPSKVSYATVMNAWAKVGTLEAAEKAEALLRRMLKGGDAKRSIPKPDTIAFNAAINAWATSGESEAGTRALQLLDKMKDLAENEGLDTYPDIISYNTVLSAWSHSGSDLAAPQTEKIVQGMEEEAKKSGRAPSPNTVTYNTIIHAWARSAIPGSVPRAERVLNYMLKSNRTEILPDVISFTSVLDAWAKSKEPHKSARTRKLLDMLLNTYEKTERPELKPTQIPFNTVLNACAFSAMGTSEEEQREALEIAVSTFAGMRYHDVHPDTVTYGNMLKCIANLMPQGDARNRMAFRVFDKCRKEGLVGNLVWNEIRRAVPSRDLEETYNFEKFCGRMLLKDLPKSWRQRNRFDKNAPKRKPRSSEKSHKTPQWDQRATIVESIGQSGKDL